MAFKLINKRDSIISLLIGFLISVFFIIIIRVLGTDMSFDWHRQWDFFLLILFPVACYLAMLVAYLFKDRLLIIYQIVKFGLVGALNTFIDIGILNGLILLTSIASGSPFIIFKGISFCFAAVNSYFWNKHWTFEKKDSIFASGEFIKFFQVTFIGFLINVGTASLIVNIIGPQYGIGEKTWSTVGALIAVFVGFLWNFFGSKFIVFKK